MWRFALGLLMAGLLSACGFELRGKHAFVAAPVQLEIESMLTERKLARELAQQWQLMVKPAPAAPSWRLRLLREEVSSRGVLRGADGRANEYELTLKLDYQWLPPQAEPLAEEKFELRRSYYQPSQDLIGHDRQREEVLKQLRAEAAARLINQLSQLTRGDYGG